MQYLSVIISNIVTFIIQPIVTLLFALAFAYFVWGMARFILNAEDAEGREKGRQAMIWGVVGLFIMTGVIGILFVLLNTFCNPVSGAAGGFFCRP